MLVLTRKPNQQLHIGNDIVITVVKVRGNTIRLGIEAPRDVRILRSELDAKPAADSAESEELIVAEIALAAECEAAASEGENAPGSSVSAETNSAANATSTGGAATDQAASTMPSAIKRSPLKQFTQGKQSQATRNLEDSPLCHCPPQSKRPAASKNQFRRGPLNQGDSLRERAPLGKGRASSFAVISRS